MSDAAAARASEITALVEQAMQAHFEGGESRLSEFCSRLGDLREPVLLRLAKLRRIGLLGEPMVGASPAPAADAPPERLGDFELLELLGRGGMGVVYRARQISLDREVAVKLIRPEQVLFPGVRERFQREVEVIARLQNDGIVRLHCFGEDRGVPWFAMELVRGCSLADAIARHAGRNSRELGGADLAACLPDPVADGPGAELFAGSWERCVVAILERAALAIDEAHGQGVIHRDIKPSNIMVTATGRVVVLDFGLAASRHAVRLTRSGAELGTVHYMAPEQFRGTAEQVDERVDVYALGVVLRELLTLRPAFDGTTVDEVARQVREGLTTPFASRGSRADRELETVCMMAMERDPRRRYPTARLLARDLRNWLEQRPVMAVRPTMGLRLLRAAQRHRAIATALVLSLLATVLAPLTIAWRERGLRQDLERVNATLVEEMGRADGNLRTAAEAMAKTMTLLQDEDVHMVPDLRPLVDQVVAQSNEFLEGLATSNPSEPTTRLRVAEVLLKAAQLQLESKQLQYTVTLLERVLLLLDGAGGDIDRRDRAELEARLTLVQLRQQRGEQRITALREALARVTPHGDAEGRGTEVRVMIARCHEQLGIALSTQAPERLEHLTSAHRLYASAVATRPNLAGWLEVSRGCRILAMDRISARDAATAASWNAKAEEALKRAEAVSSTATPLELDQLASELATSATNLVFAGKHGPAMAMLTRAEQHLETVMRARPSRSSGLVSWLQTREMMANSLLALEHPVEARAVLRGSLQRADPWFAVWPEDPLLVHLQVGILRRLVELAMRENSLDAETVATVARLQALLNRIEAGSMKYAVMYAECSRCCTLEGRLALRRDDAQAALVATRRGEAFRATAMQQAVAEQLSLSADPALELVAAEALLRLQREDEAAATIGKVRFLPKDTFELAPSLRRYEQDPRFAKVFTKTAKQR